MTGFQLFEDKMASKQSGDGMKFDPSAIIALIQTIIPLITNCFNKAPASIRRRLGNRSRLIASLRRDANMTWPEAVKTADAVYEVVDDASDAEIQLFVKDCCC